MTRTTEAFTTTSSGVAVKRSDLLLPSSSIGALRKRNVNSRRFFRPPPSAPSTSTSSSLRPGCFAPFCKQCPPPNLLFCSVINSSSDSSDDSRSDSGSEVSFVGSSSSSAAAVKPGLFGSIQRRTAGAWKQALLKLSNYASMLCVLDCTILPIVTVVLPLFGIVVPPAQMEWLHELGHSLALFFVMPVGGLATTMNYTQHKKLWISSMGWFGLFCVLSANVGCHASHVLPGAVGKFLHHALHTLHHGLIHRVVNLTGCALLLTSNYISHKQGTCKDPTCTHEH